MTIRSATPEDAEAILRIYAPYILTTAITFEYVVPTLEEFRSRIETTLEKYPYLVAEEEGRIVGYAYGSAFHPRAAFQFCAQVSIYLDMEQKGRGYGKALYLALESALKAQGILNINASIAWIDTPNEYLTHQSPEFHAHMGYKRCAHFHQCGYKFGQWFDIIWMEKMIGEHKAFTPFDNLSHT